MMKRVISLLVVLSLVLSCMAVFAAPEENTTTAMRTAPLLEKLKAIKTADLADTYKKFSDVGSHWAKVSIGKMVILELAGGKGNGRFAPNDRITVEEFLTMVILALGLKPESTGGYWADRFIKAAEEEKLIGANEFKKHNVAITREQAAKIITNAALLVDKAPEGTIFDYIRSKVKDYPYISDSHKQSVLLVYALGIMGGSPDGKFNPKANLTRAEASVIVIKNLDRASRVPMKPSPDEVVTMTDGNGVSFDLYSNSFPYVEMFAVAKAFQDVANKTKGYARPLYNPENRNVSISFHESKEEYEKDYFSMDAGLEMKTELVIGNSRPYYFVFYQPETFKSLHKDAIYSVFKALFHADTDKFMTVFNRYLDLGNTALEKQVYETYKFDGRSVQLRKNAYDTVVAISISLQ